ncbi:MAG: hypothetical protein V3S20_05665 [Dehalococcoidia bacterium]
MPHPVGHLAVDADGLVLKPGVTYHGGVCVASSGGAATVTVYDSVDASGDVIDEFSPAQSKSDRHPPDRGVIIRRGLYVDLGSNVDSFVVYFSPEAPQPSQDARAL